MSIIDDLENAIKYVEQQVGVTLQEVTDTLGGIIGTVYKDLIAFLAPLETQIASVETSVLNIGDSIKNAIESSLGKLIPGTIDVLAALVNDLRTFMAKITDSLVSTETILASTVHAIKQQAPGLEGFIASAFTTPVIAGLGGFLEIMERAEPQAIDPWLEKIAKIPNLPPEMAATIDSFVKRGAQWQALAIPVIAVLVLQKALDAAVSPIGESSRQFFNREMSAALPPSDTSIVAYRRGGLSREELNYALSSEGYAPDRQKELLLSSEQRLDARTATTLVHRNYWDGDRFQAEMRDQAIDGDRASALLFANKPLLGDADILIAHRRGYLSDGDSEAMLRLYGFNANDIALRKRLTLILPGLTDLMHLATRRAFDTAHSEEVGAFADLPTEMVAAAEQIGVTAERARMYWAAHWRVPDINEAFEMLHRDVINADDLREILRLNGLHPGYRGNVEAIAYRPISLRLIRGMRQQGSITEQDVERAFKDLGLKRELVSKAVDYVEKAVAGARGDQARQLTDGLRKEVLRMYVQGKVDVSDAHFAMTDLGFTDAEATFWIKEADFLAHAETLGAIEDGIKRLYLKSFLKADEAEGRLKEAGVPPQTIAVLFQKWNLEKQYQELSVSQHSVRELSKGETIRALEEGILDQETARTFLGHLGYHDEEVNVLVAMAQYAADKQARTEVINNFRALYTSGARDRGDVSNALDALGLVPNQRDGMLATWDLERERRTEHLPIATIRDMVKTGFMTVTTAVTELRYHRFTDDTIAQLIEFWQQPVVKRGPVQHGAP